MEVPLYTEDSYYDDLMRVTEDLADPDMALTLVRESQPTVRWMRDQGIRWIPMFGRQAYKVGGKFRFWGGLVLEAVGGGPGLIDMEYESAKKVGIDVRFETKATALAHRRARRRHRRRSSAPPTATETIAARAVVLASGGFEANTEMRTRYLGPNWDLARVRGTPVQHGRRHPHGARHRRPAVGPLERLPLRAVGLQRALARRPQGRRQLPEALLPARPHRQRRGRALRRRGRRLPQLHVREVRPRGHRAAAPRRVPDLRPEGRSTCCARSTASARSPRRRPRRSRSWRASSRSTSRASCARCASTTRPCSRARSTRPSRTARGRAASRRPSRTGRSRSTRRRTSASR